MSNLNSIISNLQSSESALDEGIRDAWGKMMNGASIRGVLRMEIQLKKLVKVLHEKNSISKVKKHHNKLVSYLTELQRIKGVELSSKNYLRKILTPLKELRLDFEDWCKKGSITNIINAEDIKYILKVSAVRADAEVLVLEGKTKKVA